MARGGARGSRRRTRTAYELRRLPGWAIERDGVIIRSHPRAEVLGAWLDATLAEANEYDASDIAKAIEQRPAPTYEEPGVFFADRARPEPSRDPFSKC